MTDRDPPYDLEEHAALATEDDADDSAAAGPDPLRVVGDCYDCGAKRGELHWPTCASLWGTDEEKL
ncbi:hypothetical protein AB0L53_47020 [Nonomuraea sp. NPDC052129]|uniref:hypothetical protein n=1 Tax=Nonomuraea sp. NPDC052129 TaxID=3154651 RepID=UPI00343B9A31